jgi:tetratricopeptide (TPR) repeat protein
VRGLCPPGPRGIIAAIGLLLVPALGFAQDEPELDDRLRQRPTDVELRLERAESLLAEGRFDEALVDCEVAASLAPNDPSIALTRGRIHLAMGELELAEVHFTKVLEAGQPTIEVLLMRGAIREETSRYEEALADYLAARKLAQKSRRRTLAHLLQIIEVEQARARALEALGRKREAKVAREHAKHLESLTAAKRDPSDS